MEKECSKCRVEKSFPDSFFRDSRLSSGYRSSCKSCDRSIPRDKVSAQRSKDKYILIHGRPENKLSKKSRDKRYRKSLKGKIQHLKAKLKRRSLMNGRTISADEWKTTLDAFGKECVYCFAKENITMDHFLPLSMGGTSLKGNMVPACHRCNSIKQDTPPDIWCSVEKFSHIISILNNL